MSDESEGYILKILVVGDLHTGKTSFIRRYVEGVFNEGYKATIGLDFHTKNVSWPPTSPSVDVSLHFWDIGGQERYRAVTHVYYKEADGALLVYDLNRPDQFQTAVTTWKADIDAKVKLRPEDPNSSAIPVVLVGNKSDLLKPENEPDEQQMKKFCEDQKFLGWFKTSAKLNSNLDKAVFCLLGEIMKEQRQVNPKKDTFRPGSENNSKQPGCAGC